MVCGSKTTFSIFFPISVFMLVLNYENLGTYILKTRRKYRYRPTFTSVGCFSDLSLVSYGMLLGLFGRSNLKN